jgi:hypothetical protein
MISCLAATILFLSSYQHTHESGWFFHDFKQGQHTFLVHTWVSNDKELIKFIISNNANLKPGKKVTMTKGTCAEGGLPYTTYEAKGPAIK